MRIIESSFRKLYQEYLDSGLSVRDFCANQSFAVSTFYYWKKRLESKEIPTEFVPLMVGSQSGMSHVDNSQAASVNDITPAEDRNMEFTFPNGTKLEVKGNVDLALLKTIVHLY